MKKVMLLSVLTLFLIRIANAQHGRQKNNYLDINAGIGLLPAFVKDAGKAKTLPLSLSADYKLAKHFSLGAFAGYSVTETSLKALPAGGAGQMAEPLFTRRPAPGGTEQRFGAVEHLRRHVVGLCPLPGRDAGGAA